LLPHVARLLGKLRRESPASELIFPSEGGGRWKKGTGIGPGLLG
jgi:hypothetical protein